MGHPEPDVRFWREVEEAFSAVLAAREEERAAVLDAHCGAQAELRREVEELLGAHERAQEFIPPVTAPGPLAPAVLVPEPLIGEILSHYQVLAEISRGGMGIVYRALDVNLGRQVALKVLPKPLVQDAERHGRFVQEARAAAALEHPHVATIYEIDDAAGTTFIAMELIRGETLSTILSRGPVEPTLALEWAKEIAEGLAHAHEHGIVHRDLKPGNIMITRDNRAKIIDFGLAKLTERQDGDPGDRLTATDAGRIMGTAAYMSPEQTLGLPVDARSDVFSFGIVLFEMVAGVHPFKGASQIDTLHAIQRLPPRPLPQTAGVADLEGLLDRCLAKDPAERCASMKEALDGVRAAWRRVHSGSGAGPVAPSAAEAKGPASARRLLQRPRVLLTTAALVLLAVAAGWRALSRSAPASPPIASIVVLPLQNLSGDAEQEYFADGLTEALISDLARIRALRVISRTSAMHYKHTKERLPVIAQALGVDGVVEGSIVHAGGRVRITAQLVEAKSDHPLWSGTYERDAKDVLALQRDVARAIARELQVVLTPQERAQLARSQPVDPEAHRLYLKGRYMWNKRTSEDLHKALQFFQAAIDKDPRYAPPHSGLADAYTMLASVGMLAMAPHDGMPKARAAAQRALELDPALAEAQASLALVKLRYDWDPEGAEREYRRAIELNPGYASAHQWYSECLSVLGRHEEALAEAGWALHLDPLSLVMNHNVGRQLFYAHRLEEAITESRKTLEMDERFNMARVMLGLEYAAAGRADDATREFQVADSLLVAYAHGLAGRRTEARRALAALGEKRAPAILLMYLHLGLGEKDAAFAALEQAFQERSDFLMYMRVDPTMDPLRKDPRFDELLRRVRMAAYREP